MRRCRSGRGFGSRIRARRAGSSGRSSGSSRAWVGLFLFGRDSRLLSGDSGTSLSGGETRRLRVESCKSRVLRLKTVAAGGISRKDAKDSVNIFGLQVGGGVVFALAAELFILAVRRCSR